MDIEDERLTTQQAVPPWVWREHLARYEFASRYAAGMSVIDCACGSGIGARQFAEAGAQTVEAFDGCETVIAACQQAIRVPALRFRTADALNLPLPEAAADLYVSLETIEHLDDDRAFLAEVCRVLRPQGVFICSTPNRFVSNPGKSAADQPCNRFHRREYAADEFLKLLGAYFEQIELFGQNPQWRPRARLLGALGRFLPGHLGTRITQVLKLPRYLHDDPAYHAVVPADDGRFYEYMVAVCRRPVHRGLSQFSRQEEHCGANGRDCRENGTVPLEPRKGDRSMFSADPLSEEYACSPKNGPVPSPVPTDAPSTPWLSVVMPTYNGERYLPAALESIRLQGDPGIEVIAVDDGSTDGTLQILRQSSQSLPLTVIERGRIGNWVANTNHAFSLARGEYLSMLHQDDCWLPGRLAVLKELLANHPHPVWLCHASWFIDDGGRRLGRWRCPLPVRPDPLPGDLLRQRLLVQNFLAIGAVIFRRETALVVGGLDERLSYAADWDFWLKLAAAGDAIYWPEPLSCFRIHEASQTAAISRDCREFERQLNVVLDRRLEPWLAQHPADRGVAWAAKFSVKMNTALAAFSQGTRPEFLSLARQGLALGPCGWHRYLRDSRIIERTVSRLRAMRRRRSNQKL